MNNLREWSDIGNLFPDNDLSYNGAVSYFLDSLQTRIGQKARRLESLNTIRRLMNIHEDKISVLDRAIQKTSYSVNEICNMLQGGGGLPVEIQYFLTINDDPHAIEIEENVFNEFDIEIS